MTVRYKRKVFLEGWHDRNSGATVLDCPYCAEKQGAEYDLWLRGYRSCQTEHDRVQDLLINWR